MPKKKNIQIRYAKFGKAGDFLKSTFEYYGIERKMVQYKFLQHWAEIVGEELREICEPTGLNKGVLYIRVPNNSWVQELEFSKAIILKRVQKYAISEDQVQEIRFQVK